MDGQTLSVQTQMQLERGISAADCFINKSYLINAADYPVLPMEEKEKNYGAIRLYHLEHIIYDAEENINDKLISVYSALQNVGSSVFLLIDSQAERVDFYVGTRSRENASTAGKIFEKSFQGNYSGSSFTGLKLSQIKDLLERVTTSSFTNAPRNVSCVTAVPSMRDQDKRMFVQGMEKLIDTMQGEQYTALLLAAPVGKDDLETMKRGYEELYSSLSPFAKTTVAYGQNKSKSISDGVNANFSTAISSGISKTTSTNKGRNASFNAGTNKSIGIAGFSSGSNQGVSSGYSSGISWSDAITSNTSETRSAGRSYSESNTLGDSLTFTIEHQNKSIAVLLQTIEQHLKRISACESFGIWSCSSYFLADDIQTSVIAANAYKALMAGDESGAENAFLNVWGLQAGAGTNAVLEYIKYAVHPVIAIPGGGNYQTEPVTPATMVSGRELPMLLGIPQKSVSGLNVSAIAEFGRNVFTPAASNARTTMNIGKIFHMGHVENCDVNLDLNSLTSHCFITGSTGSGKSNTTYCLIDQFIQRRIPFLVVEPAKGEYKAQFGGVQGINIFSSNPVNGRLLRINPFQFDKRVHVLEHLDRLIEIFNACWEMHDAMPAILKKAIETAYEKTGWDLLHSFYVGPSEEPVYPTFANLLVHLPHVIAQSDYSTEIQGNYTGALVTRVASLTNGIVGQIFCDPNPVSDAVLFDQNTIIDLSRIGSTETKSLIMGLVILRLTEYRSASVTGSNKALQHVTILEEAHNLLKRTTGENAGGSSLVAKSVEMISNSIAEMRTYGEGFVIVDQSPTAVDISAIKNTNTKIIMRLPEMEDCKAMGSAAGLKEEQIRELSRLGTGIAVVMQNNWLEAILAKINRIPDDVYAISQKETIASPEDAAIAKGALVEAAITQLRRRSPDCRFMLQVLEGLSMPIFWKQEMQDNIARWFPASTEEGRGSIRGKPSPYRILEELSGCRHVPDIMLRLLNSPDNREEVHEWFAMLCKRISKYIKCESQESYILVGRCLLHNRKNTRTFSGKKYGAVYHVLFEKGEGE